MNIIYLKNVGLVVSYKNSVRNVNLPAVFSNNIYKQKEDFYHGCKQN